MKTMPPRVVLLLCCFLLNLSNLIAQVINDECSSATLLEFSDTTCEFLQFDFSGASPSAQNNDCFLEENDVWFKYEQVDSTAISVSIININSAINPYIIKYHTNCFGNANCIDEDESEFGNLNHTFEDFSINTDTTYLRVFAENDVNNQFLICIQQEDISNENIFCKNAIDIPAQGSICNQTLMVHDSMNFHGINFIGNDSFVCYLDSPGKWYDLDVPPNKLALVEFSFEEYFDEMQIAVFQNTCGSDIYPITCSIISNQKSITTAVENNSDETVTYHLQLGANNTVFNNEPFTICATTFDPYPNEICEQAISINSDSTNINCEHKFEINLLTAWSDFNLGCPGQNFLKDVWFHYQNEKTSTIITAVEFFSLSYESSLSIQMYKGNCDSLELQECVSIGNSIWDFNHPEFYLDEIDQDYYFRIGANNYVDLSSLSHNLCFIFPSPPVNNDCENATWLLNQNEYYPYALSGSLSSLENECSEFPDIWYKFIYSASNAQFISLFENFDSFFPPKMALFKGSCNNLIPIACNNEGTNFLSYLMHNPDLINDTFYLAIYKPGFHTFQPNSYGDVRLSQNANEPKEGEYCSIAHEYTLGEECHIENINIEGHSFSGIGESCSSYFPLFDTWVKTSLSHEGLINIEYKFSDEDVDESFVSLYGGSCFDLEFISCFEVALGWNKKQLNLTNFNVEELFVKFGSQTNDATEIMFCIQELEDWHINELDVCQTSGTIIIQDSLCHTTLVFNNENALQSEVVSDCPGYEGGDVWFDFIMPSSGKVVVYFEYITGSTLVDGAMSMYTGDCDNLKWLACDDDSGSGNMPSRNLNEPSLAGQKIYIQFYSFKNEAQGEFGICVYEPFEAKGDFCLEAIEVQVKNQNECQETNGSIATISSNGFSGVQPSCGAFIQWDIWFHFKNESDKQLIFETKSIFANPISDGKAILYGGTCDSLIFLACKDDNGSGDMPFFDINEILDTSSLETDSLFIQFWDVSGATSGAFNYCLYEKLPDANENLDPFTISVFPNPTSNLLHIIIDSNLKSKIQFEVFSIDGKRVYQNDSNVNLLNKDQLIDVSNYQPGLYILKISSEKGTAHYNFVKQ